MKLDEVVGWYQKKIGTYDKQQWEKTVEQKILDGLSTVQLKTAKLKTDLIDVDLVRGSTFPKAKAKQSLFTVIRLALLRYFLLPLYAQWWVKQTSPKAFGIFLTLYILQMVNWAVYTFNVHRLQTENVQITNFVRVENISSIASDGNQTLTTQSSANYDNIVSLWELLIPMILSLLLSLIHSQIVATNTASGSSKSKHRRYSNTPATTAASGGSSSNKQTRMRRRKKLTRLRSNDSTDTSVQQQQQQQTQVEPFKKSNSPPKEEIHKLSDNENISMDNSQPKTMELELNNLAAAPTLEENSKELFGGHNNVNTCSSPKKRNVNWHSPIHNYVHNDKIDEQQQTSQQTIAFSVGSSSSSSCSSFSSTAGNAMTTTSSTTNGSDLQSPNNGENVETVNEGRGRHMGDDDGFESLNGKSSSGEENAMKVFQLPIITNIMSKTQLRQRLNAVVTPSNSNSNDNMSEKDYQESSAINYARRNDDTNNNNNKVQLASLRNNSNNVKSSSSDIDEEGDDETELISSPASLTNNVLNYNECTTSATEWLGITTNSDECSYSSDMEKSDSLRGLQISDGDAYDADFTPALLLNSHGVTDRISCTIWEHREIKKAQLSVLQISSCILDRVESMAETNDYIYLGICFAVILSLLPCFCRLCEATLDTDNDINLLDVPKLLLERSSFSVFNLVRFAYGHEPWQRTVLIIGSLQRLCLALLLFIIFAVAERTFKQRFLYAKLFSHLTSSRRARKSNLPHFRLNKVRNIKTWLSVRAYMKKRGPQRSVNVIVSTAFIVTLLLLAFLSVEWMKDSVQMHSQLNLEALMWATFIGIYLLRFMTLGNKIHEKYRSVSVLITEQINLYLQIEQKPKKKDELMVANSVLKLAADLLKELESPFKISGLCANPYLFTTVKVVILSALSGVLSEMLGFKLKLHKIKIK